MTQTDQQNNGLDQAPELHFVKQNLNTYNVKKEKVEENINLINSVFRELREQAIEGVKYAAYKMGGNVFVHIVQFGSEEAHRRFTDLPAFKNFRSGMSDRQEEKTVVNEIQEIGSYAISGLNNAIKQFHK